MTSADSLLISQKELMPGLLAEVWTVNRADKLNALNQELLERMDRAGRMLHEKLEKDLCYRRALIIQGAGEKAFVAGADIAAMNEFSADDAENFAKLAHRAFARLEELPIPTVAAVHGFALGGGMELASACDVIISHESSNFGQPEAYLGLIPGFGGCARFVQRLGLHKALELLFNGKMISATEAKELGLIQTLVAASDNFEEAVNKYVTDLVKKSAPIAIAKIKEVARSASVDSVQEVCNREIAAFAKIFASEDKNIGIRAFLNKEKAVFSGK